MRTRIFSLVFISAMISIFVFGILVVKAQEQPKEPEKKEETDKSAEKRELTDEEIKTKVSELVKLLSSDDFKEREKAKEELIKLGQKAIPFLEEAIKNTEDLEVGAKLREVIDLLKSAQKSDDGNGGAKKPFILPNGGGQMIINRQFTDATGTYTYESLDGTRIRITALPNGGEKEVREFESDAEFKEKWPEIHAKFQKMKFFLEFRQKKESDDNDDDDTPGIPPEVEEKLKEMEEELEKEFGEEGSKELEKELEREFKGREGHQQYIQSMRTDEQGNKYKITINDGKVTAEFNGVDGSSTVKSYESYEAFKEGWPEFAEQFPWLDKEYKPYKRTEPGKSEPEKQNLVEDAVFDSVSEALQSQLKIDAGVGLVIKELVNELEEVKGFFKEAGFERYDILLEVNGEAIVGIDMLTKKLATFKEGENLVFKIIRGGSRQEITITK